METEEEILMAAGRKRRQCSRFLGRRLVQSTLFQRVRWGDSTGSFVFVCARALV